MTASPSPLDLGRSYSDAYNEHDIDGVCAIVSDGADMTLAGGMFVFPDVAAWREHHIREWTAFPDARWNVTHLVGAADLALVEGVWTATFENGLELPGMPSFAPTGKRCTLPCAIVVQADGGRLSRIAGYWNSMVAMTQLGVMPG